MKKVQFTLLCVCTVLFIACGGKKELTKNVPLEDIVGTHSDLLDVSDDDSIKVMLTSTDGKYWSVKAVIPLSNTTSWSDVPGTDENASEYFIAKMGGLDVVYYDINGSELDYDVTPDWSAVESLLKSEEIKTVKVSAEKSWGGSKSYKDEKRIFDKVASVGLKKADLSKVWRASSSSSSSSSSISSSGKCSADIDKMLDEYEKFVDKYIAMAKKAQNGDISALSEYANMLESAEKLGDKLDACDGDMSATQISRYTRITSKMASAAM